jgi:hypothetical protein
MKFLFLFCLYLIVAFIFKVRRDSDSITEWVPKEYKNEFIKCSYRGNS